MSWCAPVSQPRGGCRTRRWWCMSRRSRRSPTTSTAISRRRSPASARTSARWGVRAELRALGLPDVDIRTFVRTGDTPRHERVASAKRPPHIVVTTPESLYILLGSESGRRMLASTRTVIVDEIHAMVGAKRGVHLSLTLERLEALAGRPLTRVGLSATQKTAGGRAPLLLRASKPRAPGAPRCHA